MSTATPPRTCNGATWEPARQVFDPGQNNQTIGNQIAVLPNGDLINIFDLIKNFSNAGGQRGLNVALIRSSDKGQSWSRPTVVARHNTIGISDPESGAPVRTGDIIPDIAVDPNTGRIYVVWQDARFNNGQADGIALSVSNDGGRTWSVPVKVNATPTSLADGNQQAFTPSVAVAPDGTVAVSYYDFRFNDASSSLLTDYWVVHCHPSSAVTCSNSADFGSEVRVTATSFDKTRAPFARGYFTGDYQGLAASANGFITFFGQSHGSDPASILAGEVRP